MKEITVVSVDNLHESIRSYIVNGDIIISSYEDMKDVVLNMIKSGYMFNMDRERLRDAMEIWHLCYYQQMMLLRIVLKEG